MEISLSLSVATLIVEVLDVIVKRRCFPENQVCLKGTAMDLRSWWEFLLGLSVLGQSAQESPLLRSIVCKRKV